MNIVAFAGSMKSGKSFTSNMLTEMDDRFSILSFASTLKDLFAKEYNIKRDDLDDTYNKELYREAMQSFGDFYRSKNEDYFVTATYNKMEPTRSYVLDDPRRLNELSFIIKLGGIINIVFAEPNIRKSRGWKPGPADNHPSECELPSLSFDTYRRLGGDVIYNNNRWDLKDQLKYVLNKVSR